MLATNQNSDRHLENYDTLRNRVLDAIIDGQLGDGIIITRKKLMDYFEEDNQNTTGCFLSNSEMTTGMHSPTYLHFTQRVGVGTYRIHPQAIHKRMQQRGLI